MRDFTEEQMVGRTPELLGSAESATAGLVRNNSLENEQLPLGYYFYSSPPLYPLSS